MTAEPRIASAAEIIAAARLSRTRLAALRPEVAPRDQAEAYAVQDAMNRLLIDARRSPIAGWKIGCTTPVMQAYLKIDNPCAGAIFADTIHRSGFALAVDACIEPGIECEIAVRIGRDLPAGSKPYDREGIAAAVASVSAAIEIVDARYVDWRALSASEMIADDFFGAGCVLGEPVSPADIGDLAALAGRTLINGDERGRGRGADVLGHPLNALAWLANALNARGLSLKSGDIVMTGSLVQTIWLKPGDAVTVEINRLGAVSMTF